MVILIISTSQASRTAKCSLTGTSVQTLCYMLI